MGSFGGRRSGTSPEDDGSRGERCVSRIFLWDPGFCALLWDFPANGARREAGRERRTERKHWFRGNLPPVPRHSRATAAQQRAIYIKTQPAQAWLASTQSETLSFLGMGSFGGRRSGTSPEDDGSRGERCVSRIFLGDPGFCAFLWDFPANGAHREAGRKRRTERRHWFRGNMRRPCCRAIAAPQRAIYIYDAAGSSLVSVNALLSQHGFIWRSPGGPPGTVDGTRRCALHRHPFLHLCATVYRQKKGAEGRKALI